MIDEAKERKKFEETIKDSFPNIHFVRFEDGFGYVDRDTRLLWNGWLAAKRDAAEQLPVEAIQRGIDAINYVTDVQLGRNSENFELPALEDAVEQLRTLIGQSEAKP